MASNFSSGDHVQNLYIKTLVGLHYVTIIYQLFSLFSVEQDKRMITFSKVENTGEKRRWPFKEDHEILQSEQGTSKAQVRCVDAESIYSAYK